MPELPWLGGWLWGTPLEKELDEPVRLNRPREVLDGSWPASVETVPLAGLYIASGTLGRLGTEVSRPISELSLAGIGREPRGAGGGGGVAIGCVFMRGSCFAGPPRLANRALRRSLVSMDERLALEPCLIELPWSAWGLGCTTGLALGGDAVGGRAPPSLVLLKQQCQHLTSYSRHARWTSSTYPFVWACFFAGRTPVRRLSALISSLIASNAGAAVCTLPFKAS